MGWPTLPMASAAARRVSASSRSCTTAGSAPTASARSFFRSCCGFRRWRISTIPRWWPPCWLPLTLRRVLRSPPSCGSFPPARADGMSADAGRPPQASAVAAVLLGLVPLVIGLGVAAGVVAAVLLCVAASLHGLALQPADRRPDRRRSRRAGADRRDRSAAGRGGSLEYAALAQQNTLVLPQQIRVHDPAVTRPRVAADFFDFRGAFLQLARD